MAAARSPRTPRRPTVAVVGLLAALVAPLLLLAGAGAADAADGYRYWNYFHVTDGAYVFAQTGPGGYRPEDGSVEAYRYGLSSAADGIKPRTAARTYTVDDICGGTSAPAGRKRVAVLIDYGTEADAGRNDTLPQPRAACAVVPTEATGQQVLGAVAKVRLQGQLTCGIDGYPASGCSVTVKNPPAAAAEKSVTLSMPARAGAASGAPAAADSDDGGAPWAIIGVAALVVVLVAGTLGLSRRRSNT